MYQHRSAEEQPPQLPQHRGDQGAHQTISWQDQGPTCLRSLILTRPIHDGDEKEADVWSQLSANQTFYPNKANLNSSPRDRCAESPVMFKAFQTTQDGRRSSAGLPYPIIFQLIE